MRGARSFIAVAVLAVVGTFPAGRAGATAPAAPPVVRVTYDAAITDSFTGRVYLMLERSTRQEPRFGPSWFGAQPFFAMDVEGWKPGTPLVFGDDARGFPGPWSEVAAADGTWTMQAVMRRNLTSPVLGGAAGNAYSRAERVRLGGADAGGPEVIELRIDRVVEATPFLETERIRYVEHRSELLSAFHGRDVTMRAAVILPRGYGDEPERRYPAAYWIGGFGSTHRSALGVMRRGDRTGLGDRLVRVVPDPSCYGGHHVFVDSANNGPWSRALVEELIPHLEATYRLVAEPWGRFLAGHSSGGWSSLWLQIDHPRFFGGVWSIAPDPVDFRDFQRIDLYAPGANMYRDEAGARRPLARTGDRVLIWYEDFARMETVLGEGGQLRSFEWVFSERGPDGLPRPLYDRESGDVDPTVAESWRRYDIRLQLEERWPELREPLAGKLHVFMGGLDTFYLDGATRRLAESLEALGSDAVIEIDPKADHGSIATPALAARIDREMLEAFERGRAAADGDAGR